MVTSSDPRQEIRSLIAAVRRRWLLQTRIAAGGTVMAAGAVPLALGALLVRATDPAGLALLGLMAAAVVVSAAAITLRLRLVQRAPGERQVARFIEEEVARGGDASLEDRLVSAVEVVSVPANGVDEDFKGLVLGDAARRVRDVDPAAMVTVRALRGAAVRGALGVALFVGTIVAAAPAMRGAADVGSLVLFPGRLQVEVLPGDVRVPVGSAVRLRTVVRGVRQSLPQVVPVLTISSGTQQRDVSMTSTDGAFEYSVPAVDKTFSYRVTAGGAHSALYTVTVLMAPRVTRIDLSYSYPPFAGLSPREEQDGGDIYAPAGTRVRVRIHSDKPIDQGEISFRGAPPVRLRAGATGIPEAEFVVARDEAYRVSIADRDGLRSGRGGEYFIRVMDDRPPTVRILRPSADQHITPLQEIAVEARADDDHGVAALDLVYAVGGGAERTVQFARVSGTPVERVGTTVLSAEALGVKPGDVISYYARARDVARGKRPTQATSDIYFLEVKPFAGEFVAAESAASGPATSAQLDGLVDAQKQIISSTWNIERRADGGRSPEDIRTVLEAQSLLKSRAERMSAGRPRRGPRVLPPQSRAAAADPGAPADPLAAALEAMTRALEQLETDRTKDALPHEMAALNALLQLQAEVRRREIFQQQANGGGNGSGRSGQDLSALFDKELQRQQKTNYETPSSAATPSPDRSEADDSLLDRIRDLARRQEDLSGRQAALAASRLTPEEIRRQLEKLTREQTALRQETEELARRGGQTIRDAAQQMAGAAGELRREDTASAARDGARAAAQLRRAESQTAGSSAAAGQRAAADSQIEAHQVAQEQRRIAREAERIDATPGPAAGSARRQLADDKGRLADRVDELKRTLARGLAGLQGTPRTAGQELEDVARRMRDSAKTLREGTGGGAPMAAGEHELARVLDHVAGQLHTPGSSDTRKLSAQLSEAHAIRERLQRLEQEAREGAPGPGTGGTKAQRAQQGSNGPGGSSVPGASAQRAADAYKRELERTRQALDQLAGAQPPSGPGGGTPEGEQFSRSSPGTEAFKQDRGDWASLRKDVDLALERYEAALSRRVAARKASEAMSTGGNTRVPDAYQESIARYFESLASAARGK